MADRTRATVLAALLRLRPASRKQLALATRVSPATVSRAVETLIAEGLVVEVAEVAAERRGRREVLLDLAADAGRAIGIDLGASRTRAVATDAAGAPLAAVDVPTPTALAPVELAEWLLDLAAQVEARAGDARPRAATVATASRGPASDGPAADGPAARTPDRRPAAIAIGLPGAVAGASAGDAQRGDAHGGDAHGSDTRGGAASATGAGRISNAANLRQVEHPDFLATLEAGARAALVAVDNDANLALVGEQHAGAAAAAPSAAMVTVGAGLGVGLAVEGRVLRGRRGIVGEFGMLPAGPGGETLESLVTGPGLMTRAAHAGVPLASPAEVFRPGPAADALRGDFDRALTLVLAAVAAACDPDVIVLGGGIAASLASDLERYEDALAATLTVAPQVVATELGDLAGAVGAAVTALHGVYAGWGVHPGELTGVPAPGTLTREALGGL